MAIKSLQTLVSEAMQEIKTINADEALKMVDWSALASTPAQSSARAGG